MRVKGKHINYYIITLICIVISITVALTAIVALCNVPKTVTTETFGSLSSSEQQVKSLQIGESTFLANTEEDNLKSTGLMGVIYNKHSEKDVFNKKIYALGADKGELSTQSLTLNNLDYSVIAAEVSAFSQLSYIDKQLQNNCSKTVYINFKNKSRARMDMKIEKTYVDGSNGHAPYFGVWDIYTSYEVSPIVQGKDRYRITNVQVATAPQENLVTASGEPMIINQRKPPIKNPDYYPIQQQINTDEEFDAGNGSAGTSYTFQSGKLNARSNTSDIIKVGKTFPLYTNVFGIKFAGNLYDISPNGTDDIKFATGYRVQHIGTAQVEYTGVFAGISGIKIAGKVFAPSFSTGDFNNPRLSVPVYGTLAVWSSDNVEHSYGANLNTSALALGSIVTASKSNEDFGVHSYQ